MKVAIIDYGAGNIASVKHALERIGVEAILTADTNEISNADKVIFPGVGRAKAAMEKLRNSDLDKTIKSLKQPVLGICLGMQLLCSYSEEDSTECLGVFETQVRRFIPARIEDRIPHMGWTPLSVSNSNNTDTLSYHSIIPADENNYVYFVHSYFVPMNDFVTASANYLHPFAAAMYKDNFYGVQFHPEKSGRYGEEILRNFINL